MLRLIAIPLLIAVLVQAPICAQENTKAQQGKELYERHCAYCHRRPTVEGELIVAPTALSLKYKGAISPYIDERKELGDADALRVFVRTGVAGMLPFRKTEVSDEGLRAIAAYIASNVKATAR